MSKIETFNSAVSDAINKENEDYIAMYGTEDFIPEATIEDSEDFNCGALCNELEYLHTVSQYYTQCFNLDIAESENLESLITAFINLPRRSTLETDEIYRTRFKSIVNQSLNRRRGTKWAFMDALRYFMSNVDSNVQIIEQFDIENTYFQIRIEGTVSFDDVIFLDNPDTGFIDQNFIGGAGVGVVISYIGEIIDRIKAAGVDYDILFISQDRGTKTIDCVIGAIQQYKTIDASILRIESFTKTSDAVVA